MVFSPYRVGKGRKKRAHAVGLIRVQGIFAVVDTMKESSLKAIAELRTIGLKAVMLTGDNEHMTVAIARLVGVDEAHGSLMPDNNPSMVRQFE